MGKKVKVFTDGASKGNPGRGGIGIVLLDESDSIIQTYKKFLGHCTNNIAEYNALIESISLLKKLDFEFEVINFYSDSELIVKQITGAYKIKNKELMKLAIKFWHEIKSLNKQFTITHIPREQNKTADRLANEAVAENAKDDVDRSLLIEK